MTRTRIPPSGLAVHQAAMPTHIKLYGSKSDRFEAIKHDITESLGYEPSNPEVVGILMSKFGTDADQAAPEILSAVRS